MRGYLSSLLLNLFNFVSLELLELADQHVNLFFSDFLLVRERGGRRQYVSKHLVETVLRDADLRFQVHNRLIIFINQLLLLLLRFYLVDESCF